MTQQQIQSTTLAQPTAVCAPEPDDSRYFPPAFAQHLNTIAYGGNEEIARAYIRRDIARGREIAQVLSPWSSIRDMDVLDIGCGYGGLLLVMKEMGARTISGLRVQQRSAARSSPGSG